MSVAGTGIGALIGPPVVSRLISGYGWRVSYVILGSSVLVVVVLCAQFIRRDPAQMGQVAYGDDQEEKKVLKQDTKELSLREAAYTTQFWIVFGMIFSLGFCVFAIMVHIVPHAAELGISAISAANILATIGGASIVGKVLLGRAADRIGSRQNFIIGFILMSAALFWVITSQRGIDIVSVRCCIRLCIWGLHFIRITDSSRAVWIKLTWFDSGSYCV